jgi:hypothetical protein
VNNLWIRIDFVNSGWNSPITVNQEGNWHGFSSKGGMKSKGFPPGPFNEADESEARRAAVLEYADLHNPEARKRILERANQALKDARALIERLNAMEAAKASSGHSHHKGGKSSKD